MSDGVTAQEMSKQMRSISVSEFFEKNRHLLGFDNPQKALITVVKEAVDNSLDACEEAKILPDIFVEIKDLGNDRFKVVIEDNGPGIVKAQIPKIFGKLLYGSKFHRLRQSRGQQGIGISSAVLYSQLTVGKPTKILSSISKNDPLHVYTIHIDTMKNEPEIISEEKVVSELHHGTRVELEVEGKYMKSKYSPYEYMRQVAVMNPCAQFTFHEPTGERILYERAINRLPKMPKEIKPHPHGVELGILMRMLRTTKARNLSSFLGTEFSRMGKKSIDKICKIAEVDPKIQPKKLARDESDRLLKAMQEADLMAPPTDCLAPIGEQSLKAGLSKELNAEFVAAVTRSPAVYRGYPFQIEAGVAYGGDMRGDEGEEVAQSARVMRYANKVPLLYQQGACAITKAVSETSWKRYGLNQPGSRGIPTGPIVIAVHMASVWVPYTSESKEAVANYPEIIAEMKLALQECGRQLNKYLRARYRAKEQMVKRQTIERYAPEVAASLAGITGKSEDKILKNLLKLVDEQFGKAEEMSEEELDSLDGVSGALGGADEGSEEDIEAEPEVEE